MSGTSPEGEADDEARGWAAIDAALFPIYGDQEPLHYGTLVPWAMGGPDPLRGLSAYRREHPRPHWHIVTYGLSELFGKEEGTHAQVSGYGFELTFRLADVGGDTPPDWALAFLQNLARYVFKSGNVFENGHYLNLNGPIALGQETAIRSVAFLLDPELPPIDTPNGRLTFLQVVGITLDEETAIKRWSPAQVMTLMGPSMPHFITDLGRASTLADEGLAARVNEGAAREGSSTGMLFIEVLAWDQRKRLLRRPVTELTLGANQVAELTGLLPLRLPFERPLLLRGNGVQAVLRPANASRIEVDNDLILHLGPATVHEIVATVRPRAGVYPLRSMPELAFRVVPTNIRDSDGRIVQTIG